MFLLSLEIILKKTTIYLMSLKNKTIRRTTVDKYFDWERDV